MNNVLMSTTRLLSSSINSLSGLAGAFKMVISQILGPVLSIISVAAVIYAIVLGFNYAKAQDASEREKVKGRMIGAVVGAVIMIAGAVICFAVDWNAVYTNFNLGA